MAQKPLHVITLPDQDFKQSVYFADHVCHFEVKNAVLTTCLIKIFKYDMSYILTEPRELEKMRFPNFIDDTGAITHGPESFTIWFE